MAPSVHHLLRMTVCVEDLLIMPDARANVCQLSNGQTRGATYIIVLCDVPLLALIRLPAPQVSNSENSLAR